jgi:3-oxoacyl-[acyl-carrier protein] reductase
VVNSHQSQEAAEEGRSSIEGQGGECAIRRFDVLQRPELVQAIDETTGPIGPLAILVNNAAAVRVVTPSTVVGFLHLVTSMADEGWDRVVATNLIGVYACTYAAVKVVLARKLTGGRIMNIGSVGGETGITLMTYYSAYSATKAALMGLTKALTREFAHRKITANVVSPGFIASDATAFIPRYPYLPLIPLGRVGQPEEVTHTASCLASERAAYIVGQAIRVDGGMYM